MKRSLLLFSLGFLVGCTTIKLQQEKVAQPSVFQTHLDQTRLQFAPDARTAVFNITPNGRVLKGETNLPEAKAILLERLQKANIPYQDSIKILPEATLGDKTQAVVTISVANIRTQPRHPAELATQALLGTPVTVLKKEKGWYLVQTPDRYIAWVDGSGIKLMATAEFTTWQKSTKLIFTKPYGAAFAQPDGGGATVSDLVYGNILEIKNQTAAYFEVSFPDGRRGFIPVNEAESYSKWIASRQPTEESLVQTGKKMLGIPYLWGGTSFKGVDCSGFTKTVYFANGLVIPRDASQQVTIGTLVDTQTGWENLRPGDLLFFGSPAMPGKPERVVHVGMWIGGNQEFIHSAGLVQISSFNPIAANYDASEHKRFLRAKRISPETSLYDLRSKPFYE